MKVSEPTELLFSVWTLRSNINRTRGRSLDLKEGGFSRGLNALDMKERTSSPLPSSDRRVEDQAHRQVLGAVGSLQREPVG